MDMTQSIAPKSDQLNAEDLLTGPRTFTIAEVKEGSAEQPVNVHLVEFPGRPFKPSKTVRRIMVAAWGKDSAAYAGRRMTLYRDPAVRFGGQDVGGIRVSHMSHLEKRLVIALTTTRGKRAPFTVEPLIEAHVAQERADTQPVEPMTARTRGQMFALLAGTGLSDVEQRARMTTYFGREIASRKDVTETEARRLIRSLQNAEAERQAGADPVEPGLFEDGQPA